ncbi:hypothetical protein AB7M45_007848 [Bradyrhizobium elkanii]|uniref:hypothetical protein n=1 Tax=Bradyrhizobium elkanii TaxID=29448 RepID=UPI000F74B891|nr:hypothetical protein [Bradyrhizobium elkanii]MCW2195075.1 hypothetical protein [Bradyrhizobium elkanii]NWL67233.1 hypothetical protein [Bradyrhizobium elkanii]
MTDRIRCCIPGCGRTFKREASEDAEGVSIMCGRHWRMGDLAMRNRHKQLRARARWFQRRYDKRGNAIERSAKRAKFFSAWQRTWTAANVLWHRIKDDVTIKAAFGAEDAPRRRPKVEA